MRTHLKLLAALLVHVGRTVHCELLDPRRQRNRATNLGAGALGRVHDLTCRTIENPMVKRFEPDANILFLHLLGS